jgi:hypothetical protein
MPKKRRVYISRVVGNQVMTSADLERLHKYMLEIEGIDHISDEMRAVVEELWPELAHKRHPGNASDQTKLPFDHGVTIVQFKARLRCLRSERRASPMKPVLPMLAVLVLVVV